MPHHSTAKGEELRGVLWWPGRLAGVSHRRRYATVLSCGAASFCAHLPGTSLECRASEGRGFSERGSRISESWFDSRLSALLSRKGDRLYVVYPDEYRRFALSICRL